MKCSIAFKDGEPPEDAEDPEEEAKKLKFPWHCEKGIIDNIRKLNDEFNDFRGLHPVKIFITGPPASGKTSYSEMIAKYYNIPHIQVNQQVQKALALAAIEEGGELSEEIKTIVEELKDKMVEEIEANRPEDIEEPEEIDRDKLVVRLPDTILFKLLRMNLNDNACRNRGYILDGFPRTFKDAQSVFLIRPQKYNEDGELEEQEEEEVEEGEEKSYEGYISDPDIFP